MHIAIDVREACRPQRAGKGHWTFGFVSELLERDIPLTLFADSDLPDAWSKFMTQARGARRTCVSLPQKGVRWHWSVARFLKADDDIDLYVSPTSYIVPSLLGRAKPCIPVVHDLIAFRGEPHDLKATAVEKLTLGKAVANAAHVCTVSAATKQDLLRRYGSLSPSSVTPIFSGRSFAQTARNAPDGRTILCWGTLSPRKNQKRLIEAFAALPSEMRMRHRLILVGARGWRDEDVVRLAEETPGVQWRQYLPEDKCKELLSETTVFALPSLYEGFGMALLDAMTYGIPSLTSDRGSLKEVAGDAAIMVDPESVESIAEGLKRLLSDGVLRASLSQKALEQATKFTWPRTVDLFLEAARGAVV